MCQIPHALGRRAYGIHKCGRKKGILSGALSCFSPSSLPPLLFTIYQCDQCLFWWGRGGLWLSCQVFLVIGALSRLPTVEPPGCLRHPTTIYIARQLLTVTKSKEMTTAIYRLCTFKCGFHQKSDNKLLQIIHHLDLAVITTNLQLYLKPCLWQSAFIYMYPLISEKTNKISSLVASVNWLVTELPLVWWKFGCTKRVDKGRITTVKYLANWRFKH